MLLLFPSQRVSQFKITDEKAVTLIVGFHLKLQLQKAPLQASPYRKKIAEHDYDNNARIMKTNLRRHGMNFSPAFFSRISLCPEPL